MALRFVLFCVLIIAGAFAACLAPVELDQSSLAVQEQQRDAPSAPVIDRRSVEPDPTDERSATLVVRAIDKAGGAPLAGVRVCIHDKARSHGSRHVGGSKGTLETSPITAADGQAEFELPAAVELLVTAHGHSGSIGRAHHEVPPLELGERRELTLEIPTGDDLHYFGRVLAREDRRPIAGATVEVVRGERSRTLVGDQDAEWHTEVTHLAETVTGSDGLFELRLASWKKPDIRIRAAGFGQVFLAPGSEHDTPERARDVLLSRSASLRARLVDARGVAIPDAAVKLWTESDRLGEPDHGELIYIPSVFESEWSAIADAAGRCVFEDLPPDVPFHVEVHGGDGESKEFDSHSLNAGEAREVEWTIRPGCRVEGYVFDQHGQGVVGHSIWLQRAESDTPIYFREHSSGKLIRATTDPDARFVFDDVSPGKWRIGPAPEREDWEDPDPDGIAPLAQVIEVRETRSRFAIDLRVHRGLHIRGRVLSPAGEPAQDGNVSGSDGHAYLRATAGSDGAFVLGPLVPGTYSLTAYSRTASGSLQAQSEPVEADGGDEDVVLRLRATGSMSGTVIDASTGSPCSARLCFASPAQEYGITWMQTAENGEFRIEGLTPGIYDLVATGSGARVGVLRGITVEPGAVESDLAVMLAGGATLSVRHAGKIEGACFRVFSDGAMVAFDGIPPGGKAEVVVPHGRLVIEFTWNDGQETRELDLAEGQKQELTFGGG